MESKMKKVSELINQDNTYFFIQIPFVDYTTDFAIPYFYGSENPFDLYVKIFGKGKSNKNYEITKKLNKKLFDKKLIDESETIDFLGFKCLNVTSKSYWNLYNIIPDLFIPLVLNEESLIGIFINRVNDLDFEYFRCLASFNRKLENTDLEKELKDSLGKYVNEIELEVYYGNDVDKIHYRDNFDLFLSYQLIFQKDVVEFLDYLDFFVKKHFNGRTTKELSIKKYVTKWVNIKKTELLTDFEFSNNLDLSNTFNEEPIAFKSTFPIQCLIMHCLEIDGYLKNLNNISKIKKNGGILFGLLLGEHQANLSRIFDSFLSLDEMERKVKNVKFDQNHLAMVSKIIEDMAFPNAKESLRNFASKKGF